MKYESSKQLIKEAIESGIISKQFALLILKIGFFTAHDMVLEMCKGKKISSYDIMMELAITTPDLLIDEILHSQESIYDHSQMD